MGAQTDMAASVLTLRPPGLTKAEQIKQRAYEQLQLAAVDTTPVRAAKLEEKRRKARLSRRAWLLLVEQYTWKHRRAMASRHAAQAWYGLQPNHTEVVPAPAPKPPEPERFVRCGCGSNQPQERDAFGVIDDDEQHWHEHHGLRQCNHCSGIVDPASVSGWHEYAVAIMQRANLQWCDRTCGEMYRATNNGIAWCRHCDGPISPHPLEASNAELAAHYKRLVLIYYTPVATTASWEIWKLQQLQRRALEETGRPLHVSAEDDAARDAELEAATGGKLPRNHKPRPLVNPDPEQPSDPVAPNGSPKNYFWHKAREKGQIEKIQRVLECGAESMAHLCTACDKVGPKPRLRCDNHRLCLACRAARVKKFRDRFQARQKDILQKLWRDPLRLTSTRYHSVLIEGNGTGTAVGEQAKLSKMMRAQLDKLRKPELITVPRFGGRWAERFLTLTIPHTGNARQDVRELQTAWGKFHQRLKEHVRRDLLKHESAEVVQHLMREYFKYVRVLELTAGENGDGHAHLHVWMLSPFVHHELLRHYWGASLSGEYQRLLEQAGSVRTVDEVIEHLPESRQRFASQLRGYLRTRRGPRGEPLERVWFPMVHLQKVHSGGMGAELCKYLIKDGEKRSDGSVELMDPELFAKIYAALEGVRAIAASRGFLTAERTGCYCHECGGVYKRWIEPTEAACEARGPPSNQLELPLEGDRG